MGQKTKKSPTPSTGKKIGAELPKDSPKGTPSSLPPGALRRLRSVAGVDPNDFHDMVADAQSEAERRVAALLGSLAGIPDPGSAAAAAIDSFLVSMLRATPAEEIVTRGGSAPAFASLKAEVARDWARERARRNPAGDREGAPVSPPEPRPLPLPAWKGVGLEAGLAERQRRTLAFEAACSRALSRDEAFGEEDRAQVEHRFVCLTCGLVTDLEHDDCRARSDRFAGAPTLSAVAEIARTTEQEPEDVVRTLLELGLRVLGRTDRNAYFDGRRLWELLTYGSEA